MRPTLAEIDLAALRANYAEAERLAGDRQVIAVVKADAYGHGAVQNARALIGAGCHRLGVVTLAEAQELRDAGIDVEILLLGGVHDAEETRAALEARLVPVVHHAGHVELLRKQGQQPIDVQVEVDTGMRRVGVPPDEALEFLVALTSEPALRLAGLFTHLACADETDLTPVRRQLARFDELLDQLAERGIDPGLVHVQNSAGLLAEAGLEAVKSRTNAIRPGLMLYGASPAPHFEVRLRPVMTLKSRVVHLRRVKAGKGVGYGHTFRPKRATNVATLPVGYADGVPRSLANRGVVRLAGRVMPVVGNISMDYVTVDVGDAPVALGDEAVVFGAGGPSIEEMATAAGTLAYEVMVRIGARVPRVVVE